MADEFREVRVWEVASGDKLAEIKSSKLDLEARIENWIVQDISVLSPGLLIIGRQVRTAFDKSIDLLCIDSEGGLVIVELKRGQTPREVTAQALDYASWVKDLSPKDVEDIAAQYLKGQTLEDAFEAQFGKNYSDVAINGSHAMRVVASDIDSSTERIIRYLSETHGVDINAVRFQFFQSNDGHEFLVRTFTVDPDEAQQNIKKGTNARASLKTLKERLEECHNDAELAFFNERLNKQETGSGSNSNAHVYRVSGTIRWYMVPRREYAIVTQIGRFPGDEQRWRQHLSIPELVVYRGGKNVGFRLYSRQDFEFFQEIYKEAENFRWGISVTAADESTVTPEDRS